MSEETVTTKRAKGFATMTPDRVKEIAGQGGRAAHKKGKAHQFSTVEAIDAGRKGGQTISQNREYMRELGRKGGQARAAKLKGQPNGKD